MWTSNIKNSSINSSEVVDSQISMQSNVQDCDVSKSNITNSTINCLSGIGITLADIKHSIIKNYNKDITNYDIEYCKNRDNIVEGKVRF